ncbi:tetratricopeptide repeat protein [Amycolatopsis japonica]|uniref:tetratricopeptide repeat protein n=1 Tax=Amycolatopsis japonica TaxID=208439 RepID=UPI00366D2BD9
MAFGAIGNLFLQQGVPYAPAASVTLLRPPSDADSFVGRSGELEGVLALLSPGGSGGSCRETVGAITGMAGIGKTALARRAGGLAVEQGWFTGGAVFVDLRGYDADEERISPSQVFASLLYMLGMPHGAVPKDPSEQAAAYHALLDRRAAEERRVLVVLDNAASNDQFRDLLPRHKEHRGLVTSRDWITTPDIMHFELNVLSVDASLDLLKSAIGGDRAGSPRVTENDALLALVEVCGRVPLAVEIASATLVDEPWLSVGALVEELADTSLRAKEFQHGERAIYAAFDRYWKRIQVRDSEVADFLARLTLNPGPDFSDDAAAALAGRPMVAVRPWLRMLRQAGMVQRTTDGRWRMHDLVRAYARRHLPGDSVDTCIWRLLDYYLHTASEADRLLTGGSNGATKETFSGKSEALAWFDRERANLVAAVALARENGSHLSVGRLAARLASYLGLRGRLADWFTVNENALQSARQLAVAGERHKAVVYWQGAVALQNLGDALIDAEYFEDAIDALQESYGLFRYLNYEPGEAHVLHNAGVAMNDAGRFDDAITVLWRAIVMYRKYDDKENEGRAQLCLSFSLWRAGRLSGAVTCSRRAASIFAKLSRRDVECLKLEGIALERLGVVLVELANFEGAIVPLRRAATCLRKAGNRGLEIEVCIRLAMALRKTGRDEEARVNFRRAAAVCRVLAAERQAGDEPMVAVMYLQKRVGIYRTIGESISLGRALCELGMALRGVRRFRDAVNVLRDSADIWHKLNKSRSEGYAREALGKTLFDDGNLDDAVESFSRAVEIYRRLGELEKEANVQLHLGKLWRASREFDNSIEPLRRAAWLFSKSGNRLDKEADALRNLGDSQLQEGYVDDAALVFQRAAAVWKELGTEPQEGEACWNCGHAFKMLGRYHESRVSLERALELARKAGNSKLETAIEGVLASVLQSLEVS